jgi:hypothetical protein
VNARARKARLILRHHRWAGNTFHMKKIPGRPGVRLVWWCTHCVPYHPDIPLRRLIK